jgi:hypothetical protein
LKTIKSKPKRKAKDPTKKGQSTQQKPPSQFDANWKTRPFCSRSVPVLLAPKKEHYAALRRCTDRFELSVNRILDYIHEGMRSGRVCRKDLSRDNCDVAIMDPNHEFLMEVWGDFQRLRRMAVQFACRIYKSYLRRNKKSPRSKPRFDRTKAIPFKGECVKDLNPGERRGKLRFRLHADETVDIDYFVPGSKKTLFNKRHCKVEMGGNLELTRGRYVYKPMATIPIHWQYIPERADGFDLNLQRGEFIRLQDFVIERDQELQERVDQLKKLNERVKVKKHKDKKGRPVEGCINSRQRRPLRYKVKDLHKEIGRLCEPICRRIADFIKSRRSMLCIDKISPGAKTGSFAHDHIIRILIRICENEGIPFVLVPSYHTSSVCQHCDSPVHRDGNHAYCFTCDKWYNAHENAVAVITARGWAIWDESLAVVNKQVKALQPKIKEFKQQIEDGVRVVPTRVPY